MNDYVGLLLNKQLQLYVFGSCPSCDYVGNFRYIGVQEGFKNIPDMIMVNCEGCETTLNLERVLDDVV